MKTITLKTLPEATDQEVYNFVVAQMAAQNFYQSVNSNGECMYHGDDGLRCAAGCLFTDEEYSERARKLGCSFDITSWDDLVFHGIVPVAHGSLIEALQQAHDRGHTPAGMRSYLAEVGVKFALRIPAILN